MATLKYKKQDGSWGVVSTTPTLSYTLERDGNSVVLKDSNGTVSEVGADPSGSASTALSEAKNYTDNKLSAITSGDTTVANATHSTTADSATEANHATSADSATTATKAAQDASGNVIIDTYETKTDAADKLAEAKEYADDAVASVTTVEISETEPTNESVELWVNPTGETVMNIPEINDETTSAVDTWSSNKINSELDSLKESIDDLKGSEATGISAELTGALKTYFTNIQTLLTQVAYTTQNHIGNTVIQNAQNVVEVLTNGTPTEPDTPVEPDEPEEPEVTLTSISTVYTGGEVEVGTSVNSLTGITVTAHYSDGSSANVTGYSLSGTIAEGSNTITVAYSGFTTTFTVTGISVPVIEDELSGYAMPTMPTKWSSEGDWIYASNGTVMGNLAQGQTSGNSVAFVYNKPFTGTIYLREFVNSTNNQTNSSYGEYVIVTDNEEAINNPSYETMSSLGSSYTSQIFTIDRVENQQFIFKTDGTYEQKTGNYFNGSMVENFYGIVSISKFDIPEGKVGYICTGGANRMYLDGWNAVFYEDVTLNPVAKVKGGNE